MSTWNWSDGSVRVSLRHRGAVTLNDDDTDIVGIAPGGYFNLIEGSSWVPRLLSDWIGVRREIVIRGNADGTMVKAYYGNERQQPFDPRGRDWLRAVLPDLARRGFGAEARVARIMKRDGAAGVAAELPRLQGDYLRALYIREALRQTTPLAARDVAALLDGARHIRSDYEQAQALIAIARVHKLDAETAPPFFRAVNTIRSDYEQRRALIAAAAAVSTPAAVDEMFRSAAELHSDYEQAEFLRGAVERQLAMQAPDAFFSAVSTIQSDYEQRRVLSTLLDRQLDAATAQAVMASAMALGSNYEQAEFLVAAAKRRLDEQAPDTFFRAVEQIGSDYERRRVLSAIAARPTLTDATLSAMLESARTLQNDHERAEFLIALARRHRIQGPARDQYMRATDLMRNDHEQSRALMELMRTERAAR
jgi:hypothetical protein